MEAGQQEGQKPRCTGGLDGPGLLPAYWRWGSRALTLESPLPLQKGYRKEDFPEAVGEAFQEKENAM